MGGPSDRAGPDTMPHATPPGQPLKCYIPPGPIPAESTRGFINPLDLPSASSTLRPCQVHIMITSASTSENAPVAAGGFSRAPAGRIAA